MAMPSTLFAVPLVSQKLGRKVEDAVETHHARSRWVSFHAPRGEFRIWIANETKRLAAVKGPVTIDYAFGIVRVGAVVDHVRIMDWPCPAAGWRPVQNLVRPSAGHPQLAQNRIGADPFKCDTRRVLTELAATTNSGFPVYGYDFPSQNAPYYFPQMPNAAAPGGHFNRSQHIRATFSSCFWATTAEISA
jgi:hypothetical protein